MLKRSFAVCLLACALSAADAFAAPPTPQEDEARIEELMLAESSAPPPAAATQAAAAPADDPLAVDTPVIAAVAPPPSNDTDDWMVTHAKDEGLAFADLANRIGSRVAITTNNQREHRGTIRAVNAREVTLSVRRSGGTATYTLRRDQIHRIVAY